MKKILTRRVKVRRLTVRFFQLRPVSNQLSLFDDQKKVSNDIRLTQAVDEIRERFGSEKVKMGR